VEKQLEIARTMIRSYNALGYQAYNVSARDFPGGLISLRELAQTANFPFISANIVDSSSRKPLFKPYIINKISGIKFGIIGVTSLPKAPVKGVMILDLNETLHKYLPEIRKQADYIILMAYLERDDEASLFEEELAIDFVLQSGTYRYSRNLENKNGMLIARCGNIGKYIGIIRFDLQQKGQSLQDISYLIVQKNYAEKRLRTFEKNAGDKSLEEYYDNNPNILQTAKSLENQIKIIESEIETVENPVTYDLIELDESVPDHPEFRARLNELDATIKSIR